MTTLADRATRLVRSPEDLATEGLRLILDRAPAGLGGGSLEGWHQGVSRERQ